MIELKSLEESQSLKNAPETLESSSFVPSDTHAGSGFVSKSFLVVVIVTALLLFGNSVKIRLQGGNSVETWEHESPAIEIFYGNSSNLTIEQLGHGTEPLGTPESKPLDSVVENLTVAPNELVDDDYDFGTDHPHLGRRHTYKPKGQPLTDDEREAMIQEWGSWALKDTQERPAEDFYAQYPNRDIPRERFPSTSWQTDADFLAKFLPEALALVDRVQKAILAEYGQTDSSMFNVEILDTWEGQNFVGSKGQAAHRPSVKQAGFTNRRSWDGLIRRILHAVMTEDTFVFAMGGHSAAAGHGNHFTQSYTSQIQWILEPVFARLGVRHQARNFGMGGLGTLQNGLAAGSIYGQDVDMLMWDSSMTEKEESSQDLFHRQALISEGKVPILWSLSIRALQHFDKVGADVGYVGDGLSGILQAITVDEIMNLPWASRYVSCGDEVKQICSAKEYDGICWIPRDDFTPRNTQNSAPGGRASWHPGNRKHQLQGRVLAFTILSALKDALQLWFEAEDFKLADTVWHVSTLYDSIRSNATSDIGACHTEMRKHNLEFACQFPLKARTEFTPRAYPPWTHIRSLIPPQQRKLVGSAPKNAYNPPDVFNPSLHPPKRSIDVLNIAEQGAPFGSVLTPDYTSTYKQPKFEAPPAVPIGKGCQAKSQYGDPFCDGSVDSFCSRGESGCMLYGHNDGRSGIAFDGYSGWLVMNIPDLKHGHIAIKYHSWHKADNVAKTEGWNSINNERRHLSEQHPSQEASEAIRTLKKSKPVEFCDSFQFEYSINGHVTNLTLSEWQSRSVQVQRVVEILPLLNDPNFTGGVEKEVEVAIRITGCGRSKQFQLTHIYWS